MNEPICPHCSNIYNKNASVCKNCGKYINFRSWLKMNWLSFLIIGVGGILFLIWYIPKLYRVL